MKRRLFSILAILSLLLWLIIFVGWIRSRTGEDRVWFSFRGRLILVTCSRSLLRFAMVSDWPTSERPRWIRAPDVNALVPSNEIAIPPSSSYKLIYESSNPGFTYRTFSNVTVFFWSRAPVYPIPGGGFGHSGSLPTYSLSHLFLEWPPLLLIPAILPICWLGMIGLRWRRRIHNSQNHLCLSCGYDLRATPERCPECGTIAKAPESGEPCNGVYIFPVGDKI